MFSKSCEYGLRATIYIAEQSSLNQKVGVKDIAKAINSPEAFTGKILQTLAKNHIVHSVKGPYGGFYIDSSKLKTLYLSEIVYLFDGDKIFNGCALGLEQCSSTSPCPLHDSFIEIRENIKQKLDQNTVYDILYTEGKKNLIWLKR